MSWIYQYNQPISNFHHMCTRYAYIQQNVTLCPILYIQPYIQLTSLGIYPPIYDHTSHCIHPTYIHHLYIHSIHPTILAHAIIPYIHPFFDHTTNPIYHTSSSIYRIAYIHLNRYYIYPTY